MTPLEQKVVSLELSKELVDNGIVLETEFWWVGRILAYRTPIGFYTANGAGINNHPNIDKAMPAPLLIEMLEFLPRTLRQQCTVLGVYGEDYKIGCGGILITDENPANAAAKMAITLKKKGLLKL